MNLNRELVFSIMDGHGLIESKQLVEGSLKNFEEKGHLEPEELVQYLGLCRLDSLIETCGRLDLDRNRPEDVICAAALPHWAMELGEFEEQGSLLGPGFGVNVVEILAQHTYARLGQYLRESPPHLLGFSVPYGYMGPLLVSLLSKLRPSLHPDTHVALGGQACGDMSVERLRPLLRQGIFDSVVRRDADDVFIDILGATQTARALPPIDNVLTADTIELDREPLKPRSRVTDWGQLSYHLEEPLIGAVPIQVAVGCYWGKCNYCAYSRHHGQGATFRCRNAEVVVCEIEEICRVYGAKHFFLIGECLPPSFIKKFAKRVVDSKLKIEWFAWIRPDVTLSRDTLRLMLESGFHSRWSFGLESAAPRILERMNRGLSREDLEQFLIGCREVGIRFQWANLILDFPGTTLDEALDTYHFVERFADVFHEARPIRFKLYEPSYLSEHPEEFGVTILPERDPVQGTKLYRSSSGMSADEVQQMEVMYHQLNQRLKSDQVSAELLSEAAAKPHEVDGWKLELGLADRCHHRVSFNFDGDRLANGDRVEVIFPGRCRDMGLHPMVYPMQQAWPALRDTVILSEEDFAVLREVYPDGVERASVGEIVERVAEDSSVPRGEARTHVVELVERLVRVGARLRR